MLFEEVATMIRQEQIVQLRAATPSGRSDRCSAQFAEKRIDYHLGRLRAHLTACPECGGRTMGRPRPDDLERIPQADAVCGDCGAVFTCDAGGRPLLLAPGHAPACLPS